MRKHQAVRSSILFWKGLFRRCDLAGELPSHHGVRGDEADGEGPVKRNFKRDFPYCQRFSSYYYAFCFFAFSVIEQKLNHLCGNSSLLSFPKRISETESTRSQCVDFELSGCFCTCCSSWCLDATTQRLVRRGRSLLSQNGWHIFPCYLSRLVPFLLAGTLPICLNLRT